MYRNGTTSNSYDVTVGARLPVRVLFKDTGGGRTRTKDTVGHDTNHHVSDSQTARPSESLTQANQESHTHTSQLRYMAAGPASRLGSTEPREKTGLRLSP